jgi:hypothetical protein
MQKNLRKSIFAAILGLSMAVGFGIGSTALHASITNDTSADAAQVCPANADACPTDAKKAKTSAAISCSVSKAATI